MRQRLLRRRSLHRGHPGGDADSGNDAELHTEASRARHCAFHYWSLDAADYRDVYAALVHGHTWAGGLSYADRLRYDSVLNGPIRRTFS